VSTATAGPGQEQEQEQDEEQEPRPKLWTVGDVAHYLRCSEASVYLYTKQGKLPRPRRFGQKSLYDPALVKACFGA